MQNWTQAQKIAFLGYLLLLNCVVLGAFAYLLLRRPSSSEVAAIPTTLVSHSTATPFPLPTANSTNHNSSLGETLPPRPTKETPQALGSSKYEAQEIAQQLAAPPNIRSQATSIKPRLPFTPTQSPEPTNTPSPTATKTPTTRPTPQPIATHTPRATYTSTLQPTATRTPRPTYTSTSQPTPTKKVELAATRSPTWTATLPPRNIALVTKTPVPTLRIEPAENKVATPVAVAASSFLDENNPLDVSAAGLAEVSSESVSPISQARVVSLPENKISLSWEPFETTRAYGIYSDMGSGFGVYIHKINTIQPNFIDNDLHLGRNYAYRITRLTANGEVVLAQTNAFMGADDRQPYLQESIVPHQITPTPTALPADTIVLGLVSDNRFSDDFGNLTIAGEVRNDSNSSVGQTEISITLYDAAGTIIDTAHGSTLLDVIPPGEISPFLITLPHPANFGAHSLRATARPAAPSQTAQLSAIEVRRFEDDAGFFHIKGVIKNVGNRVAKRVKVAAVIYGRDSRVINVGFTSPTPSTLAPGEQAIYDVIFTYYPRYASQVVIPFEE